MKKFILGVSALVLGLAICSEASAQTRVRVGVGIGGPIGGGRVVVGAGGYRGPAMGRPYYAQHGVRYRGGYYYPGNHHNHWGWRVWSPRFNRYHYWDSNLNSYYYYCPNRLGYYPIDAYYP